MLRHAFHPMPKPVRVLKQKNCGDCGETFLSNHFNNKFCKSCIKRRDREAGRRSDIKHSAMQKQYRKDNKEKIAENNKKYIENNKEKLIAYAREYYQSKKSELLPRIYQKRKEKPPVPHISKTCEMCGDDFKSFRKESRFCSAKCSNVNKISNKPKACAWCGKEFYASVSQEKSRNRRCCSKKCGSRYNGSLRTGENSNFWKGGVSSENRKQRYSANADEWRKSVFERDNYTCQHCLVRGNYLHAHHIKSWAKFPKLRFVVGNGITLCKDCHKEEHHRIGWR